MRRHQPRRRKLTKDQLARRERLKTIGKWTGLLLGTYEAFMILVHRRQARRDAFNAALNAKATTNKPLLVIGDPNGSFVSRLLGKDFECSDLCIDVKGCPACSNMQAADPETALPKMASNSYVVFVDSGHFERARDGAAFAAELQRVSGGDYFIAHREPWSVGAFSPFMRRRVLHAPPETQQIEWRNLPWGGKPGGVQRSAPALAAKTKGLGRGVRGLHWQRMN